MLQIARTYRYCKECIQAKESCSNVKQLKYDIECDVLGQVLRKFSDEDSINSITVPLCDLRLNWKDISVMWVRDNTFLITEQYRVGHSKMFVNCKSYYAGHKRCCGDWNRKRPWFHERHRGKNRWWRSITKQKGCRKDFYNWMRHELRSLDNI